MTRPTYRDPRTQAPILPLWLAYIASATEAADLRGVSILRRGEWLPFVPRPDCDRSYGALQFLNG